MGLTTGLRRGGRWALLVAALALPSLAWDVARLQSAAQRLGPGAVASLPSLLDLLRLAQSMPDAERLVAVNHFFNQRVAYATDMEVWGVEDYWTTPLEVLGKGRGDCEDYAIGKYAALLAAGTPPERLRLVYVRAYLPQDGTVQAHMVLAYYADGGEPLILDNLRNELLPASRRPDLSPVFSFNASGLWQGTGEQRAGDPMARLSKWRDVWNRTRQEGLP